MNKKNVLKDYVLSQYSLEKIKLIKEKLKKDTNEADPLWTCIMGKEEEEICLSENESTDKNDESDNDSSSRLHDYIQQPSTQFYFTQFEKDLNTEVKQTSLETCDIVECLVEGLEHTNGKLDLSILENLKDEEFVDIVCDLEKKLNITGTYNLCCSLNNMTSEQRMKYTTVFHTYLLLPKIIAIEEPSKMLLSVITESVQKFPDDIQKLIFIPLLNVDLKDTTIVNAIVNAFEPQRNPALIMECLSYIKELKSWHLPILQNLMTVKTDTVTNEKFIRMLSEKAYDFSTDKNFGKLVLLFIKTNLNFSEQQKLLLWEITNINQTFFKRPIENILKEDRLEQHTETLVKHGNLLQQIEDIHQVLYKRPLQRMSSGEAPPAKTIPRVLDGALLSSEIIIRRHFFILMITYDEVTLHVNFIRRFLLFNMKFM
ncbi:PREDICTED: uncharacterized protein LOC107194573 [Dufourea novaeangliae]|uniref:uncharacterized protein LOC107194573 n=1 Tax=Dufourea novaeangliae TaxID=178035 RepID=UPI00076778F5|nr:PREDICTED: uncharacterized protein LOC107194573 [Dufourea novaeangliae]